MSTKQNVDIGDRVSFASAGGQQVGLVVAVEHIDNPRRGNGWHFTILRADGTTCDVRESAIVSATFAQGVST